MEIELGRGSVELMQLVEQYYTCLRGLIALFCINQSWWVSNLSRSAAKLIVCPDPLWSPP